MRLVSKLETPWGEINLPSSSNEVRRPKGPKATDAFIASPCGQRPKGSASALARTFRSLGVTGSADDSPFAELFIVEAFVSTPELLNSSTPNQRLIHTTRKATLRGSLYLFIVFYD